MFFLAMAQMRVWRDDLTGAKSRPEFKTVNKLPPASWLLIEFFVLQCSV